MCKMPSSNHLFSNQDNCQIEFPNLSSQDAAARHRASSSLELKAPQWYSTLGLMNISPLLLSYSFIRYSI